jgi:hypothetical protein
MRIRLEDFVAETFSSYLGTSSCFRCPERPEGFLRSKLREVHYPAMRKNSEAGLSGR